MLPTYAAVSREKKQKRNKSPAWFADITKRFALRFVARQFGIPDWARSEYR
jgi:hypothetical protein